MKLGREIVLHAAPYTARLSAQAGGRLTALTWTDRERDLDLLVPFAPDADFDPDNWPKCGAFAMAPFSNRLADGAFVWEGRPIRLRTPPGQSHALHGFPHRKPWSVLNISVSTATLQYRHRADDEGWPWSFELTMRIGLGDDGATVGLELTNTSGTPMPAGLGWHPFHSASGFRLQDGVALKFAACARHDAGMSGLNRIVPGQAAVALQTFALDSASLHPQTTAFEGWSGGASLPLGADGRINMQARGASHLLVHVPQGFTHLCVEPVTLLPGALQHYAADDVARSIALGAGQSRKIEWRCAAGPRLEPAAHAR